MGLDCHRRGRTSRGDPADDLHLGGVPPEDQENHGHPEADADPHLLQGDPRRPGRRAQPCTDNARAREAELAAAGQVQREQGAGRGHAGPPGTQQVLGP